jgi:hypothetical protein
LWKRLRNDRFEHETAVRRLQKRDRRLDLEIPEADKTQLKLLKSSLKTSQNSYFK